MVSTRKKKQQSRSFLRQLEDFDQVVNFVEAVSSGRLNVVVNTGPVDREFTVDIDDSIPANN